MAEFCYECFKKVFDANKIDKKYIVMSKDLDLFENCGQYKPVVIKLKDKKYIFRVIK